MPQNTHWTKTPYSRKGIRRGGNNIRLISHTFSGAEAKILSKASGGWVRAKITQPSLFCAYPAGTIVKVQMGPTRVLRRIIPSSKFHIIARVTGTTQEYVNNFLSRPFAAVYLTDGTADPFHQNLVAQMDADRIEYEVRGPNGLQVDPLLVRAPPLLQRQFAFGAA